MKNDQGFETFVCVLIILILAGLSYLNKKYNR